MNLIFTRCTESIYRWTALADKITYVVPKIRQTSHPPHQDSTKIYKNRKVGRVKLRGREALSKRVKVFLNLISWKLTETLLVKDSTTRSTTTSTGNVFQDGKGRYFSQCDGNSIDRPKATNEWWIFIRIYCVHTPLSQVRKHRCFVRNVQRLFKAFRKSARSISP